MPNTVVIKSPTWEWGADTVIHGNDTHTWFEAYSFLSTAKKDAQILTEQGYSAIISYGGIFSGWQLHSNFGDYKYSTPGHEDKWGQLLKQRK